MRKRKILEIVFLTGACLVIFAGCGKKNETEKAGQQEEKTAKETVNETENEVLNSMEVRNNGEAIQWRADSQDSWHDRERVCQDDFCKFSKLKCLSADKSPNISCLHIS